MALHRSRRLISSDSGYSSTTSSPSQDETKKFYHSDYSERKSGQDPYIQDVKHDKISLLSTATRSDLTTSIGTELSGIQITTLDSHALDELALLVSERGVVFLRNQDVTKEKQIRISKHYSKLGAFIIEKEQGQVKAKSTPEDFGEVSTPKQGRRSEWVSDRSYEVNPSSFSILKTNESGGDIIWVSQYGLYDELSRPVKRFVDELQATHTSRLQFDSIRDLRGLPTERSPVETLHPLVRSHPVTGLKALNYVPGAVTSFPELNKKESDKLIELLESNINSFDEHTVRFKWEAGSVAIWDNRCTAYKHIPSSTGPVKGTETTSIGEKPYFNPRSESQNERSERLVREKEEERINLEEIKARFNNTPLRRILQRQNNVSAEPHFALDLFEKTPVPTPGQPSFATTPLIRLRSNSEVRAIEQGIWGKSDTASNSTNDEVQAHAQRASVQRVRVNSKGSPLRRIIQRQRSGKLHTA